MLNKNLDALRKNHAGLAARIEETTVTDRVTLFLNEHDDVNIALNNIALHRMEDPMGEALQVFDAEVPESARGKDGVLFMYGLGLGYLLRRAFIHTQGQIIVYEPHLEVLRQTLEAVDFSKELSSNRVTIITSTKEIAKLLANTYLVGDQFRTFALPAYRTQEPERFLEVLDELKSVMQVNVIGQNTAMLMLEEFTRSSLQNLPNILKYPELKFLHNRFEGMPGVVVSAGPSLDRPGVLENLKAHQDNCIIACVGQAAKALDKTGIVPDFVNILETKDVYQQIDGVSFLPETNMILLAQTHKRLFEAPSKRKFISHTSRDPLITWLTMALQESLFGYNHQGTVSITSLIHLAVLGCNPIFLLGQDLAYPNGAMYAENSVYRGRHFTQDENGNYNVEWENRHEFIGQEGFMPNEKTWQTRRKQFGNKLTEVKGWHGETLKTHITYASYIKAFEFFKLRTPNLTLVNCSEGGAYLKGLEHLPFAEALEKYEVKHYQPKPLLNQLLEENYRETEPYSPPYQKVYDYYQKNREELEYLKVMVKDGLEEVNKTINDLELRKTIGHSMQSRLKKLDYIDSEVKVVTQQNLLINSYIHKEMLEFTKNYARDIKLKNEEAQEGDTDELRENLKSTRLLYEAILKGADKLMETLDPVFDSFPAYPKEDSFDNSLENAPAKKAPLGAGSSKSR